MDCHLCKNEATCRFKAEGQKKDHCNFFLHTEPTLTVSIKADRVDYLKRLIVGVRSEIEKHSVEIHGDNCTPSEWIDALLLCSVVEKEVLGIEEREGD